MCYSHGISWSIVSDQTCKCGIRQVMGRDVEGILRICVYGKEERERELKRKEREHFATGKLQRLGKEKRGKTDGSIGLRFVSGLQCKCPFSVPMESGKIYNTPYCFRGELTNCWP